MSEVAASNPSLPKGLMIEVRSCLKLASQFESDPTPTELLAALDTTAPAVHAVTLRAIRSHLNVVQARLMAVGYETSANKLALACDWITDALAETRHAFFTQPAVTIVRGS